LTRQPGPFDTGPAPVLIAHLLGPFRLVADGAVVDTASSRRIRHMLAYLLTHRRAPVARDVLMDVFWPRAAPAAARNNLHVALSGVRQVLRAAGPHIVVERRFDAYRIAGTGAVWTDVEQFERVRDTGLRADRRGDHETARRRYETACQLYEGDFLADEPYLEWAAPIREALRLTAVEIQTRLVDCYLERSEHAAAALLARRILATDPCNERVHRQLMHCYAAMDQRHLALSQYHRLASQLWTALRVTPSTETTALFHRLRQPLAPPPAWQAGRVAS
jgi:DNA-binding SARP family transcriptional activator